MDHSGGVEGNPTDALVYLTFNFLGQGSLDAPVSCAISMDALDIQAGCDDPRGCTGP